jgi:hypothetical protein
VSNLQILHSDPVRAHASCHAHTDRNTIAQTSADGTWFAFAVLLAVRTRASVEAMALDHALEALAFGDSGDYYDITGLELGKLYLVADFDGRRITRSLISAEFNAAKLPKSLKWPF